MSKSIEEKIVSLKFDSEQFKKGTEFSLGILAKLKQSLNFEGAAKGLQNLDLSKIGDSVDVIRSKFEGLNPVIGGILLGLGAQISNFAVKAARDMGNNLIAGAKEGFGEYETQINAVQTILSNTSMKGTTIEQVNEALRELNTYADKTIYNFGEMTRNIGTFTAAGVDLDTSTEAIKGIANLAAMSGSNSQQASTAMYQLSQALAAGKVSLMDWNSVVNAGMGGQVFQDALKETARAHGVAVDRIISKSGSFRDSLQEGWITAEVLTDTLAKFTGDLTREQIINMGYTEQQADQILQLGQNANDAATKVKTFSQLMGSLNEAVGSGWAASWMIILGDFEEAKVLFTEVSDRIGAIIGESADARNAQLQIWKDLGGRTALIDALRNAFDAVMQVITPIRDAFRDTFPPTLGKNLAAISFALRDFTERLKIGADGSAALYTIFKFLFTGMKFVVDIVSGAIRILFDNLSIGFQLISGLLGLLKPVVVFLANLATGGEQADNRIAQLVDTFIMLRREIIGPVLEALALAGEAIDEFLNGDPSKFADMWNQAMAPLLELGAELQERYGHVVQFLSSVFVPVGERIKSNWEALLRTVTTIWEWLMKVGAVFGEFFGDVGAGFQKMFEGADWTTVLAGIQTGFLAGMVVAVYKTIKSITGAFGGIGAIGESFIGALDGITGVLKGMQNDLNAKALLKIAGAIGILAASLLLLTFVNPDTLMQAAIALGVIAAAVVGILVVIERMNSSADAMGSWSDTIKGQFQEIGGAITQNLKASAMIKTAAAMVLLAGALILMAIAISMLGRLSIEDLAKGMIAITVAMGLFVGAGKLMSKFESSILKSAAAMVVMAVAITALAGAVAIFGNMPLDVLIQGGIAVATALGILVGAAVLLEKFAPSMLKSAVGLVAMAYALNLLVVPIIALGLLPFPILIQGMAAVAIMLMGISVAAQQISQLGPKMAVAALGLVAMAGALNLMVVPIIALGAISLPTLIQGLVGMAAAMAILVVAAKLMTTAVVGAGAMVIMAAAIVVLSSAVLILGSMPIENMIQGLIGMAAAIAILAIAGALLTPVIPQMLAIGAGIALVGVGLILMAGAILIFTIAVGAMGPALISLVDGLKVVFDNLGAVAASAGVLLLLGAALVVLGAGALIAGAGLIVLGAGLLLVGAGLTLVGAVGVIGALALQQVVEVLAAMIGQVPAMLAVGAAFIVLGAGVALLAVGLTLASVAMLAMAVSLTMLAAIGPNLIPLITSLLAMIPIALQQFALGIVAFATIVGNAIPIFVEKFTLLVMSLLQALQTLVPEIVVTLNIMLEALLNLIVTAVPKFVEAAIRLVAGILQGIANQIGRVIDAGANLIVAILDGIGRNIPKLIQAAANLMLDFLNGIAQGIRNNAAAFERAGTNIFNAIVDGVASAISNGGKTLRNAGAKIGNALIEGAKGALGINSPSKVFSDVIMPFLFDGIERGNSRNLDRAGAAGTAIGDTMLSATSRSIDKIKDAVSMNLDMNPTIRPTLDLSGVQSNANRISGMFGGQTLSIDTTYAKAAAAANERQAAEDAKSEQVTAGAPASKTINFTQNNNSPKALSREEIYRQTNNQLSKAKGALDD